MEGHNCRHTAVITWRQSRSQSQRQRQPTNSRLLTVTLVFLVLALVSPSHSYSFPSSDFVRLNEELDRVTKSGSGQGHPNQNRVNFKNESDSVDHSSNNYYGNETGVYSLTITTNTAVCRTPRVFDGILFVALVISCVILLCIVVIYVLVWEKQNVHGWTVCSLSACLLVCFIFFALTNAASLFQSTFLSHTMTWCILNGITHHFFYIAAFAWTTLLNYDLWSSITSMSVPVAEWSRFRGKKRFIYYCIFGFGFPLIVVILTNVLVLGKFVEHQVQGRSCGHVICHIKKSARFYYAVIPSSILYFVNLVFAALILKFLRSFQQANKRLGQLNPTKATKPQVGLFVKFFILTGLTRVFEILSWVIGGQRTAWYWTIMDTYNIIVNPAGLFWIFVCRKEIKDQLVHKYSFFKEFFKWTEDLRKKLCQRKRAENNDEMESAKMSTSRENETPATSEIPEDET